SARDAGTPFHAVANDGDDRLVRDVVEFAQLLLKLEPEFGFDSGDRPLRVYAPYGEADRVFRRSLRDQDHVHGTQGQGSKEALGRPRHATMLAPRSVSKDKSATELMPFAIGACSAFRC